MTVTERKELELAAVRIREGILTSTFSAEAVPLSGAFNHIDILEFGTQIN